MKIAIGNDHAAVDMKLGVKAHLESRGIEVIDMGTHTSDSCDYPVYGEKVGRAVASGEADLGIAMGALGADAAIEAADIVLMDDNPEKIATAIGISRKTIRIVQQNIVFALAVKFICLGLGAVGTLNMWWAIFADVGVMVLAVLNATRALTFRKK